MNAQDAAWKAAVRPGDVLDAIERSLVAAGAVTELRQLHGLSAAEMDVLLWLEVHEPSFAYGIDDKANKIVTENVQKKHRRDRGISQNPQGCGSGSPHARGAVVAA